MYSRFLVLVCVLLLAVVASVVLHQVVGTVAEAAGLQGFACERLEGASASVCVNERTGCIVVVGAIQDFGFGGNRGLIAHPVAAACP